MMMVDSIVRIGSNRRGLFYNVSIVVAAAAIYCGRFYFTLFSLSCNAVAVVDTRVSVMSGSNWLN